MNEQEIAIPCISNDGRSASVFTTRTVLLTGDESRRLSERIMALNFRLRSSGNSYQSGWHVAGDPTLLIVLQGGIRIELRDGRSQDFLPGQMFIAQDYLEQGVEHCDTSHGHRARAIGDQELRVLHLKLRGL